MSGAISQAVGEPTASFDAIRAIPLPELLAWHGIVGKREGSSLRAKTDHHNIVITGNRWFDNNAGIGGVGAIDLQMHLTGENFRAAFETLTNQFGVAVRSGITFPAAKETEPERLPFPQLMAKYAKRDDNQWPIARAYLVGSRKIESVIVDELHAVGSIYANDHRPNPSLVFLHRTDCGKVVGATLRDTRHASAFRPNLGNKLTGWFAVGNVREASAVVAVESPIDALSYHTLFSSRSERLAVVSCSGCVVPDELMCQVYERRQRFVVALDNDTAGERGWQKAWDQTADWTGFQISSDCPRLNDWSADLQASHQPIGVTKTQKPAVAHP